MAKINGTVLDAEDEVQDVELDEGLLVKAANMNIHRYVPTRKPGQYDDQVETLIAVDEQTGYQNTIEILVPEGDVLKHKRYFNSSAKAYGKTARIVNGEQGQTQGNGGVLLEFVLVPKIERKAPKSDAPAEDEDTPTPA